MAVPAASAAQNDGAHPYVQFWKPTGGDTRHFYFAELELREANRTPLGNGLLGYFAVNRLTGEVLGMDDFQSKTDPKIEVLQKALRREHCVPAALIKAESDRVLFPTRRSQKIASVKPAAWI